MEDALRNLIQSSSLGSLSIYGLSKIPTQVFDGAHFVTLKIQSSKLNVNSSSSAMVELSQLKEIFTHSLDQALPFLKASTRSLEALDITIDKGREADQNILDLSHFPSMRKVNICCTNPYYGMDAHVALSYLPLLCGTYLRPSEECQSLTELAVTVSITNADALFSEITASTRQYCHSLDATFLNFTRNSPTELTEDTQARILEQFPALHQLDRAAVKLDIRPRPQLPPLSGNSSWLYMGSYEFDAGNAIVPGNAGLPPPAGQNMSPLLEDESDDDFPSLHSFLNQSLNRAQTIEVT
ncbi:hypothetical protein CPB83DRAFT_907025 [Crepidotus variabilis]|uniref:Uncharacterized protein n=1 Tax=Crepidotus variabilis TaxID=179855 RepID=A0A9P6EFN4_9AGAR|nr:hypothetical protein CPB83DRAFT_907025 [Crepidotus variabilis]